jgi:tRNA(Ile)-lysidine synthase
MLVTLIRGTGIKGPTGISPKRDGVVRPLLCVDREQILSFLSHIHQDYVTDSTNLVDDVVRNKIRLNILPLMREINPSVTEAMAATAEKLSMVSAVYDSAMEELSGQARLPLADGKVIAYELGKITSEGLLFHILQPLGFSPKNVEEAYDAVQNRHTGAYFRSSSHEMVVDRESLVIMPVVKPFTAMNIPVTGRYVVSEDCLLNVKEVKVDGDFSIVRTPDCACLDAEKVALPLVLRTIEDGDRFSPLGMRGSKLVSDFLTDQKENLLEKRRQLIVADAEGRIVWVVGRRPAHHCRITEVTKKAIVLKWETI